MCASKKKTTGHQPKEVKGEVIIKPFAEGSKSEHNAVFIQSSEGTFLLRRLGGNPFHDESLEKLAGKQVKVKGLLDKNLFLAKEIEELE
jgi:hypothetical protein